MIIFFKLFFVGDSIFFLFVYFQSVSKNVKFLVKVVVLQYVFLEFGNVMDTQIAKMELMRLTVASTLIFFNKFC